MGRHFKAKPADVNRSFHLFEAPRISLSRFLSAIQTSVIVAAFIGFLWCLWKLPQENDEFPDGFIQCPPSSYRLLNKRNTTNKCKTCPECPVGQGLTPPCGSAIFPETPIFCTACISSETVSEEVGHGACKKCQSCSPRNTIKPCTPEQDTQCGECPRGFYQANWSVDSCKKCSSCCGGRRSAQLECYYLKQCRITSCIQHMQNKPTPGQNLVNIMYTLTTSAGRKRHIRMAHQDIYSKPSEDTMSLTGKSGVQQKDNGTLLKEDISINKTAKVEEALGGRFQTDNSKSIIAETFHGHGPYQSNSSLPVTKPRDENVGTASEQKNTQPTKPLNSSYFTDIKKLLIILIAIGVIVALVLLFIAVIVTCICWRTQPGQLQRSGCKISFCLNCFKSEGYSPKINYSKLPSEFYEVAPVGYDMVEVDLDTATLEGFNLGDIPLDLEDKIALKLDYRRNGERLPGWEKVGLEFQIDQDVLKNLENEFRSLGGSPTRALLRFLGTRGRTVADLVNALKSQNVNYRDVALIIQKYYRDQRN